MRRVGPAVEVEDLGSKNGTYVDGVRIAGPVRLTEPARLRMGMSEMELLPQEVAAATTAAGAPPVEGAAPGPALAGATEEPPTSRSRRLSPGIVVMAIAAIATVAVLVAVFSTSSSSGTGLAARADVALPPPGPTPFVTHAGDGDTVVLRGSRYEVLAPSKATAGVMTLLKIDLRRGSEPPPHIHHRETEVFYLLSGTMAFQAGGTKLTAGPGDLVYLPRNVLHGYRVTSPVARVLLLAVPGGLDRFFVALAHQPALARQLSQRFGIQPVLPPGSGQAPPRGAPGPGGGTTGSIPFVTRAGAGVKVKLRGSDYFIMADSVGTGGTLGFLEINLHHGSEPPAHIHHHEAEIFYLLSGTMEFNAGGKSVGAHAGDMIFLAKGLQHAYQVTSGTARVLLVAVPGGLEQFFKALSQHPDLVQQLGKKYGIQPGAATVTLPTAGG